MLETFLYRDRRLHRWCCQSVGLKKVMKINKLSFMIKMIWTMYLEGLTQSQNKENTFNKEEKIKTYMVELQDRVIVPWGLLSISPVT